MTDAAFRRGMVDLAAMLSDAQREPDEHAHRSVLYRQHLDDLSDGAWFHAVAVAIDRETWFPTVAKLREYAAGYVSAPAFALLPPARTEEQREADREAARRGVELIRIEAGRVGLVLPQAGPATVEASEERLAKLRAQVEEIKA